MTVYGSPVLVMYTLDDLRLILNTEAGRKNLSHVFTKISEERRELQESDPSQVYFVNLNVVVNVVMLEMELCVCASCDRPLGRCRGRRMLEQMISDVHWCIISLLVPAVVYM